MRTIRLGLAFLATAAIVLWVDGAVHGFHGDICINHGSNSCGNYDGIVLHGTTVAWLAPLVVVAALVLRRWLTMLSFRSALRRRVVVRDLDDDVGPAD